MTGSIAENARRSFQEEWDRVSCPTLLVLARKSFIPAEEVDEMLRRRPETHAVSVPGTGHDLHLERPDALYGALSAFLDGLDPGPGYDLPVPRFPDEEGSDE